MNDRRTSHCIKEWQCHLKHTLLYLVLGYFSICLDRNYAINEIVRIIPYSETVYFYEKEILRGVSNITYLIGLLVTVTQA